MIVEFKYDLSELGLMKEISYSLEIPYEESTNELAYKIIADEISPLMKMADISDLKSKLGEFVKNENQKYRDKAHNDLVLKAMNGDIDLESIIKNTEKMYKEEVLEFAEKLEACPSDFEIFAQSFNRLVHSSTLPEIMEKEKAYANVISEMTLKMEKEITALNNRHQNEMDETIQKLDQTVTTDDINKLLSKQYAAQSMLRKKWESELDAYRGFQKHEFRNWIVDETVKLQSHASSNSNDQTPLGNKSLTMFVTQQSYQEESFTIHLGSQLKHNHNIRILSAKVEDLCSPLYEDESLGGLNAALGLYSSSLTGIVVLTPSSFLKPNSAIVSNCNKSTEIHFDQIDHQIEKIKQDIEKLREIPNSRKNSTTDQGSASENLSRLLKPGDFFITRHSNITSHVIFHLIISDETYHNIDEINSRHPILNPGLRNIIRTANRYDITTLTIPALLKDEMTEDMTVNWCMRRAELIFKCAKGFMIESANWGGSELNTLQFLLPHNITSDLFQMLASIIPSVFRVANPKVLQEQEEH
uniref:CSON009604 protein n=1 Tax=Culicoides sonorensis TaxID=179676 RepID=A0A336M6E5_CULSO